MLGARSAFIVVEMTSGMSLSKRSCPSASNTSERPENLMVDYFLFLIKTILIWKLTLFKNVLISQSAKNILAESLSLNPMVSYLAIKIWPFYGSGHWGG